MSAYFIKKRIESQGTCATLKRLYCENLYQLRVASAMEKLVLVRSFLMSHSFLAILYCLPGQVSSGQRISLIIIVSVVNFSACRQRVNKFPSAQTCLPPNR